MVEKITYALVVLSVLITFLAVGIIFSPIRLAEDPVDFVVLEHIKGLTERGRESSSLHAEEMTR